MKDDNGMLHILASTVITENIVDWDNIFSLNFRRKKQICHVWERSSITSAGFDQNWTPHPPLHHQNQHMVRLTHHPYIADVIIEPKTVGLSSSQW